MKKTILAISMLVIISFSTFLGIKAYNSTNISSLFNANLEALSLREFVFIAGGTGTCGVKIPSPPGDEYYDIYIICEISYDEVKYLTQNFTNYINWCCDNCSNSSYCSAGSY